MKIIDFLNDPLHAFLALVGAVIISMFGAFIKDGLMYLLARSSKFLKKKRDEDIKKRDLIV
jgi:membrane protein DedA with SNARE-associated domain